MAWLQQTPGSGRRAASPTVFEQQREELVREIAVVS
jgi:DASH complex subunit DAD1